jgi:3-oxoadipate enol-lactonase
MAPEYETMSMQLPIKTSPNVLAVNGVDLSYIDVGSGGRAVLLIHGHPFNSSMWAPQIEAFRTRHRVVVPDLRGYGKSSLPGACRETTLETFAADNLALMDALEIPTFALGGLSMGGQIVLEMYRQAPDRIETLLLADTFAGLDTAERKHWRFTTADRLEREGMEAYARDELTRMITPANAEQFPEVAAHVMEMMMTTPPSGAAAALRGRAQRMDYLPLLEEIRVPTLVIVGREDAYTPLALAEQLRDNIPGSKLVVIDGAGHMPNLERPCAFNEALESWLALPTPAC